MTQLAESLLRSLQAGSPPNVALMQLLQRADAPEQVGQTIERALQLSVADPQPCGRAQVMQVRELWRKNATAWSLVRNAGSGHAAPHASAQDALDYWSERYDRLARLSPEASVALYSLGDPELLHAATTEIVSFLRDLRLLGQHTRLLDLGCGIGRLLAPLAAEVGFATGIDISAQMVDRARSRCQCLDNVSIRQCSGLDLAEFPDGSFDLVLAADVLPYVFEAGPQLVHDTLRDMTRVVVPNGTIVLLNYSYRGEPEADCADVARLADAFSLDIIQNGSQPFKLWDATAFVLKKSDAAQLAERGAR
jgi:SAM-dependent methyltransferase